MATVADAIAQAATALGFGSSDDEAVYNNPKWVAMRDRYEDYKSTYDGDEWSETTGQRDETTGSPTLRYPLQLNPIAKLCRAHRAMLFGVRTESTDLPVQAAIDIARSPGTRESQAALRNFINGVWLASNGTAVLEEAGLLCQIYGGHVFKVAWEFWNPNLPHRIAVRSLKSPAWFWPVTDAYDEWSLLECYIGYEMDAELARVKYGIATNDKRVLYLEHWTKDSWRITVADQVPVMKWNDIEYALEGENPWGVVPVVYIPHERDGEFYGRSLVKDLSGLARELNARLADKGDAVQKTAQRLLTIRNSRTRGALSARPIVIEGQTVDYAIDIGDAPPLQGSHDAVLEAIESRGIPQSVSDFTRELWDELRHQADVASVVMGDDEIGSGRISGPVTSFRMYPSVMHTMTERANWTTGLNHIAHIMAVMAEERERSGFYDQLGLEPPGITPEMLQMTVKQIWKPMIPIERIQKVQEYNLRLQSGGVSLQTYLTELGEDDVEQEITRIRQDLEWEMRTQAALQAAKRKSSDKKKGIQGEPGQPKQQGVKE